MNNLDITVVILTFNEELHIGRCLQNVGSWVKRILVVDCHSTDRTKDICESFGVEVIEHDWPGNQASQFNWALDNVHFDTEWILRLDADEYLLPELIDEIQDKLPSLPEEITGIEFKRRHIFMGKWVKHGVYPVILLRLFRNGKARYEERLMDEHLAILEGETLVFDNDFCDHSLISLDDYCKKHLNYARREAAEALNEEFNLSGGIDSNLTLGEQANSKHKKKSRYNKAPLFWRSFGYFCYRYFLRGGFLDGKEGFLFAFIQGWWYRTMVDANILEIKRACGDNKKKTMEYMKNNLHISINEKNSY